MFSYLRRKMPANTPFPFLVPPPLILLKVGESFSVAELGNCLSNEFNHLVSLLVHLGQP